MEGCVSSGDGTVRILVLLAVELARQAPTRVSQLNKSLVIVFSRGIDHEQP